MKAVRIYKHGGLDNLIYDDIPQPECLSKDGCDASKSRRSAKNNSKLKRVSIQQFLANG